MSTDLKQLLTISNRALAEEIQDYLESKSIICLLESDNPASSVMNLTMGGATIESITIFVHSSVFAQAVGFIKESPYKEILTSDLS
ncbi:hypothetical protein ACT3CD_10005 [Geofilum sp. OHC36d9]|uniref:hypothetical protein n=1 Tax=Geofilum sp. OHC36d9 TaxID=3458413 RepID=UPI0040346A2D